MTSKQGIGESTAKSKVYAVKQFAYQEYDIDLKVDKDNAMRLARFRKSLATRKPATEGSDPITYDDCTKMIKHIQLQPIPEWQKQTQITMISIAFGQIKRATEYVQDKKGEKGLNHGQLTLRKDPTSGRMYLAWNRIKGKTHQTGTIRNPLQTAIVCVCNKWRREMCAFHNYAQLLNIKKINDIPTGPHEPVLIRLATNGNKYPYNEYTANQLLQKLIKSANYLELDQCSMNYI